MLSFSVLYVFCLVSGILVHSRYSECKSKGNKCTLPFMCPKEDRLKLGGCWLFSVCCRKKKINPCFAMHGKCKRVFKPCSGNVNTTFPCPKGRSCCVPGSPLVAGIK
uniref:Carboxypeptidase inhibitor n=1 Tax=Rhipicephalus appendiculatus TaxID=34631 RepID=A0A131Z4S9_RHIAP